jgi:glycosyltransferase involved in cell wall biosynthesis
LASTQRLILFSSDKERKVFAFFAVFLYFNRLTQFQKRPAGVMKKHFSTLGELDDHYRSYGWCLVDLPQPQIFGTIVETLEIKLREMVGDPSATLTRYHEFVREHQHEEVQWALASVFWDARFSEQIGRENAAFFRAFIGPDLHIQSKPYLRIVRPGHGGDNIGYHRDTFYGQSPYEVTVFCALTDLDARGALRFVPGSHVLPDSNFGIVPAGKAPWGKGSQKHLLGFPYAPKKITADIDADLRPVPTHVGQAIVFSPSLIHGQVMNDMESTRVSVDLRLIESFAPIKFRLDLSQRGYVPLHESAITNVARRYYAVSDVPPTRLKLDIVIPTYNRPRLLDRCVRSALEMDIPGLRVVVIDDGSTVNEELGDGTVCDTPSVIARLADPRLDYTRLEKNGGLGAVFETYAARGDQAEYMTVINDDDIYINAEPILDAIAMLDDDCEMALVQISLIRRADDRHIDEVIALPYPTLSPREFLHRYIEDESIKHTTMYGLFRSKYIAATGALKSMHLRDWGLEDAFGIDTDFLFRMATMGKAGFVNKPHILRRETDGLTARYPTSFAYCYYQYILRGLKYLEDKHALERKYARMFVAWWMKVTLMMYSSSLTMPSSREYGSERIRRHLRYPLHLYIVRQMIRFRFWPDRESLRLFLLTLAKTLIIRNKR